MSLNKVRSDILDVLLICALQDEYKQVLAVSDGIISPGWVESVTFKGWAVADAHFTLLTGTSLHIRATWASHMGREATQAVASMHIHEQPARCIAMSGICAGRRGKVSLGDVIFAERMWSYDTGKSVVEDGVSHFQGDAIQYHPKPVWIQRMQQASEAIDADWISERPRLPLDYQEEWILLRLFNDEEPQQHPDFATECPNWDETVKRLWKRQWLEKKSLDLSPEGLSHAKELSLLYHNKLPVPSKFQVHVAPMATGAEVTEDEGIFPRLAESMRKVLGLEMEASALAAFGDIHDIPVVVAKGVSDFGDTFKDDQFRHFAARAAAECMINFLRNAADLFQEPEKIVVPSSVNLADKRPQDLIEILSEQYPDVAEARSLWERAGGKASEVENIPRPRDLWQKLWKRSTQGASVTPIALLHVASDDLPYNQVLTQHLKALEKNA